MTDDLIEFIRARLDAAETAIRSWNRDDPHPGYAHTNDIEGDPQGDHYTEYDSCERCHAAVLANRAVNPYGDHEFGLRDIEAKRHLLEQADLRGRAIRTATLDGGFFDHILRVLALPFAGHLDYRDEWRL